MSSGFSLDLAMREHTCEIGGRENVRETFISLVPFLQSRLVLSPAGLPVVMTPGFLSPL